MHLVAAFEDLYTSEYKCSDSVSARTSAVAQGMQCLSSLFMQNESLLHADGEALDVTSPCNIGPEEAACTSLND